MSPTTATSLPFNPVLSNLPVYQPGRPIEEVARELGRPATEIIKMASNENPLGPAPKAVEAMRAALSQLHLYPDGNAFYLKHHLARKLNLTPENLIFGNGSNEILEFVGHALVAPGSEVVVSQYCFAVYPIVTHLCGGQLVVVPAREYGHDLDAMARAITAKTRVVFVANPNNPTGTLASRAAVLRLLDTVPADVLLVMDEAYIEFMDEPVDLLPEIRAGQRPNLLLTRTFSKIYGLAGLRLGYAIGRPDLIAAFEKIRQPFNINSLAQAAALAALDDAEHLRRTKDNNRQGLRDLEQGFRALELEVVPSVANFILARVGAGGTICDAMQQRGVIVRPMGGYQLPEWVRVSVGTAAENARCLAVLREVLGR